MNRARNVILLLALGILNAPAAHAEGVGSHGGSAVTCFKSQTTADAVRNRLEANSKSQYPVDPFSPAVLADIRSIEMLDFFNQRKYIGPVIADPRTTEAAMNEIVADRTEALRRTHYVLFEIMRRESAALPFTANIWRESTNGVVALYDAKIPTILDRNCLPIQIANQMNMSEGTTYVYYDTRLFAKLDAANRAALLFHERLYHHLIWSQHATDSVKTQAVTGAVFAIDFGRAKAPGFEGQLASFGIARSATGVVIPLGGDPANVLACSNLRSHSDGSVLCPEGALTLNGSFAEKAFGVEIDPIVDHAREPEKLVVDSLGAKDGYAATVQRPVFGKTVDPNGKDRIFLASAQSKYTGPFHNGTNGYSSADVVYYPNGVVAEETIGYISSLNRKVVVDGGVKVKSGARIHRDEQGTVTSIDGKPVR